MNQQHIEAINAMVGGCHHRSVKAGWYREYDEMVSVLSASDNLDKLPFIFKIFISSRLCLIHSEISEAMEGDRKDLPDDHLPHYRMIDVELADALIRIFDLAGFLQIENFGQVVKEKLDYNAQRADHKIENRQKSY